MPLGYFFWVIYVVAIIWGFWSNYDGQPLWYRRAGAHFVIMVLVGILGWRVFGHVVQ